jgi:hypothetical protein
MSFQSTGMLKELQSHPPGWGKTLHLGKLTIRKDIFAPPPKTTRNLQHLLNNTSEQDITSLGSRFHFFEIELRFQCWIELHSTVVQNILEGFSELKWAGSRVQVLTQTLSRAAKE